MTNKEARLSLRISVEDKKKIQKRAIDKDMKISEYIMSLVIEDFNKNVDLVKKDNGNKKQ